MRAETNQNRDYGELGEQRVLNNFDCFISSIRININIYIHITQNEAIKFNKRNQKERKEKKRKQTNHLAGSVRGLYLP